MVKMATSKRRVSAARPLPKLEKAPTGIHGFDEITYGGLPKGRPSIVCGSAGCGKTLFSMQFLVRGAMDYDEPGVFVAFEETAEDLKKNVASLGFDLDDLVARKKMAIDHVRIDRNEIEENGEYDLEGLFIRLGFAIDSIGAKRVVLDTIETLFGGLSNEAILRSELQRLFRWLKEKGVTTLITAERGDGTLTRQGLEEYVSDCVILLDHRVDNQISTRRLRIVKYRGSVHGTNEYPFLIDEDGINVVPITSLGLSHAVSDERVSTGVPRLDTMLGGRGVYRGSTVLVSGTAGAGKSSLCAHFARAACERGERVLYFAFEESPNQVVRNMRSIGIDLNKCVKSGLLKFMASRPMMYGMEMHLAVMHKAVREFKPSAVVVDPISSLLNAGDSDEARAMMVRLIDFLKAHGITAYMTSLTSGGDDLEKTSTEISSIVDSWLLVKSIEIGGERNRGMYVLKSRGMAHSNQIREFLLTPKGVELVDVYTGAEGVLTGAARAAREAQEKATVLQRQQETEKRRRELRRKREALELKIAALRAELEAEQVESDILIDEDDARAAQLVADRVNMAGRRFADLAGLGTAGDKARKNGHGGGK